MSDDEPEGRMEQDRPPTEVWAAVRTASRRDNWRNALFLAADWLIIAAAAVSHRILGGVLLYLVVLVVIGTRLRAIGNLLHEAAHHKLFAHRKINTLIGRACCAWPIFTSFDRYLADHRRHHRDLWISSDDPDLALSRLTGTEWSSDCRTGFGTFLVRHVLLVVVPVMPLRGVLHRYRPGAVALWVGAVTATTAVGALTAPELVTVLLLYWVVPWLTTYQMCAYWAELGEHGGLRDAGHHWGSRNWRGNLATRWAIGSHSDDLYHLLHHWFPSVPHHRLRQLDELCRSRWPGYAARDSCSGYFLGNRQGVSVLRDIWSGGMRRGELPTERTISWVTSPSWRATSPVPDTGCSPEPSSVGTG